MHATDHNLTIFKDLGEDCEVVIGGARFQPDRFPSNFALPSWSSAFPGPSRLLSASPGLPSWSSAVPGGSTDGIL